jgi:hypothetical protein
VEGRWGGQGTGNEQGVKVEGRRQEEHREREKQGDIGS